ncbi:phosphatase PAP2 family protein [Ruegeria jejuensis]|uniref:phosphatase PAP2 family protein n=1 Tax=Ruegeria jejuensis TaxID=3233338 RepID=UPI00355B83E9
MSMQTDILRERSFVEAAIWRNRLLLTIVGIQLLTAVSLSIFTGTPFWFGAAIILLSLLKQLLLIMALLLVVWRFLFGLLYVRPEKPIRWLLSDLRSFVLTPDKMTDGLISFVAIAVMATSFVYLKYMIPLLNPFSWDPQFASLDLWLHGGVEPWRLLWPTTGNLIVTKILDFAYVVWFFLIYFCAFFAAFDRRQSSQGLVFLVAFALTWFVGGNVLATLFSSVGPVYFEAFGFGEDFAFQMKALRELGTHTQIWALNAQQMLLEGHTTNGELRGISAMPSMHVATSVTMALFGFTYRRWLGWSLTVFAVLILLGSVHLGWHYAVDGYASIAIALIIWWASKGLVARFGPHSDRPETPSQFG